MENHTKRCKNVVKCCLRLDNDWTFCNTKCDQNQNQINMSQFSRYLIKILTLTTLLSISITAIILHLTSQAKPMIITQPIYSLQSIWQWDDFINTDYIAKIKQLKSKNLQTLYVNIEGNLYINKADYSIKNEAEYSARLSKVIQEANLNGIAVEGLLGHSDWSIESNQYLIYDSFEYIKRYNSQYPNMKIVGLTLDVEFYNSPSYVKNPDYMTFEYLTLVNKLHSFVSNYRNTVMPTFRLGQAVSYQIFNTLVIPSVKFNGEYGTFLQHSNSILGNSENNYLALMSYRSSAGGTNGIVAITGKTFEYLNSVKSKMKVLVGVETADIKNNQLSFYNGDYNALNKELNIVQSQLSLYPNYKGIVVNDFNSYIRLINL
jgi:hypothetical protein